jgi:3',5'-cyclic AMP phosphodiesterase CpdA
MVSSLCFASPYVYGLITSQTTIKASGIIADMDLGVRPLLRFVVYGDSRSNPSQHTQVVQGIMASDPDIVLHAGDLVTDGRVYDQWNPEYFEPVSPLTNAGIPIYVALGNHEHDASWCYDWFFNGSSRSWYSFDRSGAHFIILDTNKAFSSGSAQYTWLEQDLSSVNAEWIFAVFHHPAFTSGSNGDDSTSVNVRQHLVPLFETYGVDIVFNGHAHFYERSLKDEVYYIVTGGGGGPLYNPNQLANPYQQAVKKAYHHCRIDLTQDSLTFEAVLNDGSVFDSFYLSRFDS